MFDFLKKHFVPVAFISTTTLLSALFVILSIPDYSYSQHSGQSPLYHDADNFEELTIGTSTAVGFTTSEISQVNPITTRVVIKSDKTLNVRWDGTDPTSTVGYALAASTGFQVVGIQNILDFRAINTGTGNATVTCIFEERGFLLENP